MAFRRAASAAAAAAALRFAASVLGVCRFNLLRALAAAAVAAAASLDFCSSALLVVLLPFFQLETLGVKTFFLGTEAAFAPFATGPVGAVLPWVEVEVEALLSSASKTSNTPPLLVLASVDSVVAAVLVPWAFGEVTPAA